MSSATFYTGDVLQVLAKLHEASVDLVLTSPPFLALRSYLPADHPDKALEGGSAEDAGRVRRLAAGRGGSVRSGVGAARVDVFRVG